MAAVLILGHAATASAQDTTGVLREGIYTDTDHTQVIRSLAGASVVGDHFSFNAEESIDIISSASIDVRTAPTVDAMTTASGVNMTDRRFETTLGGGWKDDRGHTLGLSAVYATERDYTSIGGGIHGSIDLADRDTTLIASFSGNHNDVGSVTQPTFAKTMDQIGYTLGVAQVLTSSDALRLRYDGAYANGYQASPYRNVRFGDWTISGGTRRDPTEVFSNTIGSADGLPENLPLTRLRHAVVGEWIHGFRDDIALETQLRLGRDSWGLDSLTATADLRIAEASWQLRLEYRFYLQSAADFFADKYLDDPSMYTYYTADKELGEQRGHMGSVDVTYLIGDRLAPTGFKAQIDARVDVLYYDYVGFVLLPTRSSIFGELGLRMDF